MQQIPDEDEILDAEHERVIRDQDRSGWTQDDHDFEKRAGEFWDEKEAENKKDED